MLVEEKLIEAVRKQPELYNTANPSYMKNKLKTRIWMDIAKELKLKDGEEAKNMWLKLRGGFRDARRRHEKSLKSGASPQRIKSWKYESQMSFLQPYMSSGPREGNLAEGSDDESQLPSQPSTNDYLERQDEESSQLDPGGDATIDEVNTEAEQPLINDEGRDDDGSRRRTESLIPNRIPLNPTKRRKTNDDFRATLQRSIAQREERARQRDGERAKLLAEAKNSDDPLFNFFTSMYQLTKTLPHHYQHRVRAQLFQAVSDAEAEVMNIRPQSVSSHASSASSTATHPTPYQSPSTSSYTFQMAPIHHAPQVEQDPENLPNVSRQLNTSCLTNFLGSFQCDDELAQ